MSKALQTFCESNDTPIFRTLFQRQAAHSTLAALADAAAALPQVDALRHLTTIACLSARLHRPRDRAEAAAAAAAGAVAVASQVLRAFGGDDDKLSEWLEDTAAIAAPTSGNSLSQCARAIDDAVANVEASVQLAALALVTS